MLSKAVLMFCIVSLSACASVREPSVGLVSPSQPGIAPIKGVTHVVQKGETLWRIARMYQSDIDAILAANNIPESAPISIGQTLLIPELKNSQNNSSENFASNDLAGFIWPTKGSVITQFKQKTCGVLNKGIDIATEPDQDILAARDGKVAFLGSLSGYGPTLIVDHGDGLLSVYGGSSSANVKPGDTVSQGMVIAKTGRAPRQDGATLHFEIRKQNRPQNPLYYLN